MARHGLTWTFRITGDWNLLGGRSDGAGGPACTVLPQAKFLVEVVPPGTKACDAGGGAFRPEWREGPVRIGCPIARESGTWMSGPIHCDVHGDLAGANF